MNYYVSYVILNTFAAPIGYGGEIVERFVVPQSIRDIHRISLIMTEDQRNLRIIGPTDRVEVVGWSEMWR